MIGGIRSESYEALARVARTRLPRRAGRPKKVGGGGAGIAGLVAAWELARAGHEPVVLEARSRVGGRIHTLREPFTDGLYAEAGAMRIPRTCNQDGSTSGEHASRPHAWIQGAIESALRAAPEIAVRPDSVTP